MAENEIEVTIKWENGVTFEMTWKENDGPVLTLVKVDENGCIKEMWSAITDVVERCLKATMARIGKDMAQP